MIVRHASAMIAVKQRKLFHRQDVIRIHRTTPALNPAQLNYKKKKNKHFGLANLQSVLASRDKLEVKMRPDLPSA